MNGAARAIAVTPVAGSGVAVLITGRCRDSIVAFQSELAYVP
jgi:hypothetical protein